MKARQPLSDSRAPALVIDVGNTTVSIATWQADQVKTPIAVPTDDVAGFEKAFVTHCEALPRGQVAATVVGSVVPAALDRIRELVSRRLDRDALVIGEVIPLPMDVGVTDKREIGVDRVCAAFASYDRLQTACTVVDFGSAVTVDFVDDDGMFAGGAILPGLTMQLRSLHEHTGALPADVTPEFPEWPYGRSTIEAMQTGVCRGLAGAVRALVEAYAEWLKRWPQVIGTGGDLALMAPHCDFLDTQVHHLTLRGIGLAYTKYLAAHGA